MILKKAEATIDQVVDVLKNGGVVICPTDTVYGFLAGSWHKKAVERIYKIKKRPKSKPLPLFVSDLKMAKEIAQVDKKQEKILRKHWPGEYTFVLHRYHRRRYHRRPTSVLAPVLIAIKNKDKTDVGRLCFYCVNDKTIALRVPKNLFLQKLLKKINRPLAQTSVNISGEKSLTKISDVISQFSKNKNIALIIDGGNIRRGKPSKIIDLTGGKKEILRK